MVSWRLGAGLLGASAYAVASHWLMACAADRPWAIAALLGPAWAAMLSVAVGKRRLRGVGALLLVAVAVVLVVARGGVGSVNRLYLLQHAGIHLLLCIGFALTLRPGRLSLIGRVATRVHGSLTPPMAAYADRVTAAWALYFLAMTLLSVGVYLSCDWRTWSLLANVATPVAIGALFVGEYVLRYRLHPEFERATLMDAARAYTRAGPADEAAGR